ncbi:hypothetical protein CBU31_000347 [Salmonella enterica]|nr:hypothetical protein [Salmonella enterica]
MAKVERNSIPAAPARRPDGQHGEMMPEKNAYAPPSELNGAYRMRKGRR